MDLTTSILVCWFITEQIKLYFMQHLELKHPEEFRKCQVERGKELEVKKEKLDRKMAVGSSPSSSRSSEVEYRPAKAVSKHPYLSVATICPDIV